MQLENFYSYKKIALSNDTSLDAKLIKYDRKKR